MVRKGPGADTTDIEVHVVWLELQNFGRIDATYARNPALYKSHFTRANNILEVSSSGRGKTKRFSNIGFSCLFFRLSFMFIFKLVIY